MARGLLSLGLAQGDRLGIWSPNCAEWVLVQYATARIGAILVNLNPAYRTSEVAFVLQQIGCRVLVAARAFKGSSYVAMVDEVRPQLPALETVVWIGTCDWEDLLARSEVLDGAVAERAAALAFDAPINLQYTERYDGFARGLSLRHQHPEQLHR